MTSSIMLVNSGFFDVMCPAMSKKLSGKNRATPISAKRFAFNPYMLATKLSKINFLPIAAIGLIFRGWVVGKYQVDMNQ